MFLLVLVNNREVAAVTAGVTDMAVKVPAAAKTGPWTTSREPVSLWRSEIDGKNVFSLYLIAEILNHTCASVIFQNLGAFHEEADT